MKTNIPSWQTHVFWWVSMACVSATLVSAAPSTMAAEWEAQAVERVAVTVGKSVLISAPAPLARVSVANPQVADALVLTPRQVYLMGKSVGVTNVTLWNTAGEV